MVYEFIVKEQSRAKAWLVNGIAPGENICVAMFYYDYGVDREVIQGVAQAFADQLNSQPFKVNELQMNVE